MNISIYEYYAFTTIFFKNLLLLTRDSWLRKALTDYSSCLKTLKVKPFNIASSSANLTGVISSSYLSILSAIYLWSKETSLRLDLIDYLKLTGNLSFIRFLETGFNIKWPKEIKKYSKSLGALSFKFEPAKIRVFALVDPITQWIFDPLHKRLFAILGKIPQDGTFDQIKPINRLLGRNLDCLYSLDLSAATDRLPIVLQKVLISRLLGPRFADLWSNILIGRPYRLPHDYEDYLGSDFVDDESILRTSKYDYLIYGAGQPMGALTSWAMLALTHHFIVQFAAYKALGKSNWFVDYAVLGDDVVIGNSKVAESYLAIMAELGVKVGLHKSLISPSGTALEFAKRFIYKGHDLSAIPLKEVYAGTISVSALAELYRKYKPKLSQLLAFQGYGFRSLAKLQNKFTAMSGRMSAIILSTLFPADWNADSFAQFIARVSLNTSRIVPASQLQSLNDQFLDLIIKQISKIDLSILKYMVTVDRTRAHYGVINFKPDARILSILHVAISEKITFEKMKIRPDLYSFVVMINEFVYREIFFDTITLTRDILNELESLKGNPTQLERLEAMIPKLIQLEEELTNLPMVLREQTRIIQNARASVSRYLKLWKSANLGKRLK